MPDAAQSQYGVIFPQPEHFLSPATIWAIFPHCPQIPKSITSANASSWGAPTLNEPLRNFVLASVPLHFHAWGDPARGLS